MAGSLMTFTYHDLGTIRKVIADWTSDDATGAVSGVTKKIIGTLVKAVTNPGAAAPTDNYDIAITDEDGMDVLAACQKTLVDRDTVTTEQVYFLVLDYAGVPLAQSIHPIVYDALTIAVTAAGNSKTGRLILYYRPA